jgi:N-acyl-D-aspartate/D-glutamate deacylase
LKEITMFDLLIVNGLVIDGSGSPGFHAAVAIKDERVTIHRGDVTRLVAARTIDATGHVVCPGFIDVHSHAGLTILGEPHHDPKVRQGVTTELVGIDGISHAPFKTQDELHRYIWLDSGLNGYPPMPADWLTVADLLGQYDNNVAINIAYILGNSPVRIWGVGWSDLKVRSVMAPWEEAVDIGRRSGSPVHLTHYRQSFQGDGSHLDYIGLVEDARAEGLDVTFDCYTYPYSGTHMVIGFPRWSKDGGPERLMAALKDPTDRARLKKQIPLETLDNSWLHNFTKPRNVAYDGLLLTDIAKLRNQDPWDALFDLLIEENLGISQVGLGTNAHTLQAFVSHPYGMIGSDAILFGEYPNPRTYGCFPLVLAEFVRAEKHLRLPEAIRKMTSFPAQRLGLPDRGLLRDGFKADVVIFDPATVRTDATREDPKHYPVGIDYVIVNGKVVIDQGNNTGVLPGRALRRGHAST